MLCAPLVIDAVVIVGASPREVGAPVSPGGSVTRLRIVAIFASVVEVGVDGESGPCGVSVLEVTGKEVGTFVSTSGNEGAPVGIIVGAFVSTPANCAGSGAEVGSNVGTKVGIVVGVVLGVAVFLSGASILVGDNVGILDGDGVGILVGDGVVSGDFVSVSMGVVIVVVFV